MLFDYQQTHVARLMKILNGSPYAFDTSVLGTGKTHAAVEVAKRLDARHVIVVCPVSVAIKWKTILRDNDLSASVVSYQELRSVKGVTLPAHGLLRRKISIRDKRVQFRSTRKFENMMQRGCLVVLDEVQHAKNQTITNAACRELVKAAGRTSNSKALFLSGTLFDKKNHALSVLRYTAVASTTDLHVSALEARDMVRESGRAAEPLPKETAAPDEFHDYLYRSLQRVLPDLASSMTQQEFAKDVALHLFSGSFDCADEERKVAQAAVARLRRACALVRCEDAELRREAMAAITLAMHDIESAKADTFIRLAKATLDADPTNKVVVALNFLGTVARVTDALSMYRPMTLTGACSATRRHACVSRFQQPSTTDRLLVGNLSVLSTGIDLHDCHGAFKRTCYASPNFAAITLHQLFHRFLRNGSASASDVYLVHLRGCHEQNVLSSLMRKSGVMREVAPGHAESGVRFISDMTPFEE